MPVKQESFFSRIGTALAYVFNFYEAAERWTRDRGYQPADKAEDWDKLVPQADRLALLSDARRLYSNDVIGGAIRDIADYSVGSGFIPQYKGPDSTWGDEAETWLREWMKVCCVAGPTFDFQTLLCLGSISIDRDGDFGILYTYASGGYPQVQFIPSHRIANRDTPSEDSEWKDGVRRNRYGRPAAYNILGKTKDEDRIIPASGMDLVYAPEFYDQGRGVTALAHAINIFRDVAEVNRFEMAAIKLSGSQAFTVHNEAGQAPRRVQIVKRSGEQSEAAAGVPYERINSGEVTYFKAGTGSKIEVVDHNRPSPPVINFLESRYRAAFTGLQWPYEFAWDSSKIGGVNSRMVVSKANRKINKRQQQLTRPAKRMIWHALVTAMQNGDLPQTDNWYQWGFQYSRELTTDTGYAEEANRKNYESGFDTMTRIAGGNGEDFDDQETQRWAEVDRRKAEAEKRGYKYVPPWCVQPKDNPAETPDTQTEDEPPAQEEPANE